MENKIKIFGICAVNNLGYIGLNDTLPWRSKADFQHFKALTMGHKFVVGYNTHKTLPPLKGREVILDPRGVDFYFWTTYSTLKDKEVHWIGGGRKTYEKYAPFMDELHISHINDNTIGDVLFPDLRFLNPGCQIFNYNFEVS